MDDKLIYRYTGYLMSYLTSEQMIEWTDEKIMKEDLSEWILNISMSRGNKNVIIKELNTLLLDEKINICKTSA